MTKIIRESDALDALAYARAQVTGDEEGMATMIIHGDPGRMLVALTSVLIALALRHFRGDREAVLRLLGGSVVSGSEDAA